MSFYNKIFAKYYDSFMKSLEVKLFDIRKNLLQNLSGEVLEIGAGTGVNFQFYTSKANVLAIEPSRSMLIRAQDKLPKHANINLKNWGMFGSELNAEIQENSLDAIVCTLVMCTVPNPALAFETYKKWLKQDGKLIVIEHIHSKKQFKAMMQNVFNPVWRKIGDGCNINRNTDDIIEKAGFQAEHAAYFKQELDFYYGVFVKKE